MDHPHVARLKDVYEDETQLRLVMECCEGGELFDRIQRQKRSMRIDLNDKLLRETFKRFDHDGSGFITVQDLRRILGDCYEGQEVSKMLQEADLSGDGKIDLEEFMHYLGDEAQESHKKAAERILEMELCKTSAVAPQTSAVAPQTSAVATADNPTVSELPPNGEASVPAPMPAATPTGVNTRRSKLCLIS